MEREDIFASRPVEDDTEIIASMRAQYEGIPVLIEKWTWDGVLGHSCLVPLEPLQEVGMTTVAMITLLKEKLGIEGETTEGQQDGFLFLNFNFEA